MNEYRFASSFRTLFYQALIASGLLILLVVALQHANAQPSWLPGNGWAEPSDPVTLYVTPAGDSAWVYPTMEGEYGRARAGNQWVYHCPSQADTSAYSLSGTQSDLQQVGPTIDDLVQEGTATPFPDEAAARASCIQSFKMHLDTLTSGGPPFPPGEEKPRTYATSCARSVDNATVHVPATTSWGGVYPSAGDTLAALTPSGECAGYGTWSPAGGAVLAAAEEVTIEGVEQQGLTEGDAWTLELYRADTGRSYRMAPAWRSCEEISVPVCQSGGFVAGAFYQSTHIASTTP